MALKSDRNSLQNFQEKAEQLAEKLRLAYIYDKIPSDVARKMVVSKTVEMCKSQAKNEYVKTVIAATPFEDPKDVLAKFVVETTSENEKNNAQILKYSPNGDQYGPSRTRHHGQNGNFFHTNNSNFDSAYENRNPQRKNQNFQSSSNYDTQNETPYRVNVINETNDEQYEEDNDDDYEFNENDQNEYYDNEYDEENGHQILKINAAGHFRNNDSVILTTNVSRDARKYLIDSQGDICLIKYNALKGNIKIDRRNKTCLTGITPGKIFTYGTVWAKIKINNFHINQIFHVIPAFCGLRSDGLLGSDFLRRNGCTINYYTSMLEINSRYGCAKLKFANMKKYSQRSTYMKTSENGKISGKDIEFKKWLQKRNNSNKIEMQSKTRPNIIRKSNEDAPKDEISNTNENESQTNVNGRFVKWHQVIENKPTKRSKSEESLISLTIFS